MRTGTKKIIFYPLLFLFGFLGVSLWSSWLVTHPKTIKSGFTPDHFNLQYEEVTLATKDNIDIAGWFLPTDADTVEKAALVILHGYPAEKGDMLFIARTLHNDFNILLIDLRSFGASGGSHTTLGNKERLDLAAALDFLESRGFTKIGVLGFSLGGAVAIMTAVDDSRIHAVVSYASFADLEMLGKETYAHLFILRGPLIALMKFWTKILWEVDTTVTPLRAVVKLSTPILLIHTKPDEQISFRHAELLQAPLKNNPVAEFYFPETGSHGEIPTDFERRVNWFFLKYL